MLCFEISQFKLNLGNQKIWACIKIQWIHNYLKHMVHWVELYETVVKNGWRSTILYDPTMLNQNTTSK